MSQVTLEAQVARLSAIEDIKQLKARYCEYCDDHYDPSGVSSLFVEDAVWDGGSDFGRHEGRAAIRRFFAGISGNILFGAHLVMNPIIEVDGSTATGRWRMLMPCTTTGTLDCPAEARWLLMSYDERYVLRNATWMYQQLICRAQFYCAYSTGWAAETATNV